MRRDTNRYTIPRCPQTDSLRKLKRIAYLFINLLVDPPPNSRSQLLAQSLQRITGNPRFRFGFRPITELKIFARPRCSFQRYTCTQENRSPMLPAHVQDRVLCHS